MQMRMLDHCKYCMKSYNECFPDVQQDDGSIAIRKTFCSVAQDGMHDFIVGRK